MRRPNSILGLGFRLLKVKWLAADRVTKLAFVAALVAGGLFAATSARCMLSSSCGAASSACPYSAGAAADTPCSRR